MLMNNLNDNVRPCTQLFHHVCSKWSEKHADNIPNYNSVMTKLAHEANMEIKTYLEKTRVEDMPHSEKMVKNFYESCMKDNHEFDRFKFMHWLEKEKNMKWALLTPVADKNVVFDWTSTMAIFRKYGFNDLLVEEWTSSKDTFDYVKPMQMEFYKNFLTLPSGAMDFMELWPLIDEFEQKIGDIKVEQPEEKTYKFHELPYPWMKKYLTAVVEPKQLDGNMELSIANTVCLEDLDKLLSQYDKAFLCRYLEVRFLLYLEKASARTTSNACMLQVATYLSMATEGIYMKLHPELLLEIPQIHQMFGNLVKNINKTLQMDKENIIPQEYFTTLETMKLQVGNTYPHTESLEAHYQDLNLQADDYYGNFLKIMKFSNKPLLDDSDRKTLYQTPTLLVPYWNVLPRYAYQTNTLIVPFGLLREPFYNAAYADIFKQSSLGTLLAPKESERYQKMFNMTTAEEQVQQQLQQLFFINEMHTHCEWFYAAADRFNTVLMDLSYFNEAFELKINTEELAKLPQQQLICITSALNLYDRYLKVLVVPFYRTSNE
ncbi:uncharacterized protein [Musca autumnalis]|uniref:uncharacterized protein n=1 Tax=Musca autumnalis TaxID=221902 RepID=UPI003CEE775E